MAIPRSLLLVVILMGCQLEANRPERTRAPGIDLPQASFFTQPEEDDRPNILLVVFDDLGADALAGFGSTEPLHTPVIDALSAEGTRFQRAYAAPLCSPTRAELLTGRWSHRSGVTTALDHSDLSRIGLPDEELTLAEILGSRGYATALAGKWHLGTEAHHGARHAMEAGFDHHRGPIANVYSYFDWKKVVDGEIRDSTVYTTTDSVDEAVGLMRGLPEPWFIVVAFNAPHAPWHAPPADLLRKRLVAPQPVAAKFAAAVEAMDTELGRLLDARPENTVSVAISDNGSPTEIVGDQGKASAHELGVRVPLVIAGPGIDSRDEPGLAAAVDIFPTLLDLAGVPNPEVELDGVSLVPSLREGEATSRDWVYAGRSTPPHTDDPVGWSRMVRTARYKLVHERLNLEQERYALYDLFEDPEESTDLLTGWLTPDEEAARLGLLEIYDEVLAP